MESDEKWPIIPRVAAVESNSLAILSAKPPNCPNAAHVSVLHSLRLSNYLGIKCIFNLVVQRSFQLSRSIYDYRSLSRSFHLRLESRNRRGEKRYFFLHIFLSVTA